MVRFQKIAGLFALICCSVSSVYAINIQRWHIKEGTQVLLVERRELPIIDVAIVFKGAGSIADPQGKDNTASATASMTLRGSSEWNEDQFSDKINDLGSSVSSSAGVEYATFGFRSLSHAPTFNATVDLFRQALGSPRFDPDVLQRLQAQSALALQQSESYPSYLASRAMTRLNYPQHPYGKSAFQTVEKIKAVQIDDLKTFHQQHYARNNAIVAVVGDIDRPQTEQLLQRLLSVLPERAAQDPDVPPVAVTGKQFKHIPFPHNQQILIQIGLPVLKADDPDYFAMLVGNYILGGGGFDSRLMKVLRDQYGYTYGAYSSLEAHTQAAPFNISFSTERKNGRAALKVAQDVLANFVAQGPNAKELTQAKAYLTGSFPRHFDTNSKLLGNLASVGVYNRPDNWFDTYNSKIQALTPQDIKKAWQKHIQPNNMNVVVVGGDKEGSF